MKNWESKAKQYLEKSLSPLPQEMNELDWKVGLSDKSEKLAQHLSAFANQSGGGFMVFGVDNNGKLEGLINQDCTEVIRNLGKYCKTKFRTYYFIEPLYLKSKWCRLAFYMYSRIT